MSRFWHIRRGLNVFTAPILAAIADLQGVIMTELEALQAADAALAAAVSGLATEQAQFLTDVAAALASAGTDPAALQAVADDINAQAAKLNDLASAQVAADPATPAAAPVDAPAEPTA